MQGGNHTGAPHVVPSVVCQPNHRIPCPQAFSPACFFWAASLPATLNPSQAPGQPAIDVARVPIVQIAPSPVKPVRRFFAVTDQSAVGPGLIDHGLALSPPKEHPRLVQPPFLKRGRSRSRLASQDGALQGHYRIKR
jgi:hypothetical protein